MSMWLRYSVRWMNSWLLRNSVIKPLITFGFPAGCISAVFISWKSDLLTFGPPVCVLLFLCSNLCFCRICFTGASYGAYVNLIEDPVLEKGTKKILFLLKYDNKEYADNDDTYACVGGYQGILQKGNPERSLLIKY